MVPPGHMHGAVQLRIGAKLLAQGEELGHGRAITEVGVVLSRNPDSVLGPDVVFVRKSKLPVRASREGYLETIPDLVVEVRSKNDALTDLEPIREPSAEKGTVPFCSEDSAKGDSPRRFSDRLLAEKVAAYLSAGVGIVWVADPEARTIAVHRSGSQPRVYRESDSLTLDELIPEFRLTISDIFRD